MSPTFRILTLAIVMLFASTLQAADGLVRFKSPHSVPVTTERLVSALKEKGMTVFRQVDHQQGAANVDLSMPPTRVVIFGNPKVGTPLMQCAPTTAIDLPQKMLIWEDADGQVWLGYNDPSYLKERHGIKGCDAALNKVAGALERFAGMARADQ